jgi:hypothetical protein
MFHSLMLAITNLRKNLSIGKFLPKFPKKYYFTIFCIIREWYGFSVFGTIIQEWTKNYTCPFYLFSQSLCSLAVMILPAIILATPLKYIREAMATMSPTGLMEIPFIQGVTAIALRTELMATKYIQVLTGIMSHIALMGIKFIQAVLGTMSHTGSMGKGFMRGLLGMMWRLGLGGEFGGERKNIK